jgi:hypothetical protein
MELVTLVDGLFERNDFSRILMCIIMCLET